MDKAEMFAAMEADEGLYKEFLVFRARQAHQRDQHHSDVLEATPASEPDRRARSPTFGRSSDPVRSRDDDQRGWSVQRYAPLHPAVLLACPTGPHAAIRPAHLGALGLSSYPRVTNPWPLCSLVRRRHLCQGQTTTGLPHALPIIPRHAATTTRRLATHPPPPIVAIQPPLMARLSPLVVATHQIGAIPLQRGQDSAHYGKWARPPPPPEPEPEPESEPATPPTPAVPAIPAAPTIPTVPAVPASNVTPQDEVMNISSSDPPEPGSSHTPITVSSSDPADSANIDATPQHCRPSRRPHLQNESECRRSPTSEQAPQTEVTDGIPAPRLIYFALRFSPFQTRIILFN
ncbi:hypothetical protein FS749_006952 [Ceratobasidium sp. UAMH 11750]|nr:hypothetical protein FS749_006952 [Ceratobasidium sp. UAMH 11750]